jgi:hypothetical protein
MVNFPAPTDPAERRPVAPWRASCQDCWPGDPGDPPPGASLGPKRWKAAWRETPRTSPISDHVAPPSSAARTAWWRATRAASNVVEAPPTSSRRWVLSGDVTVRVFGGLGQGAAVALRAAA